MQLLGTVGEEHELCEGLGFIPGRVTLMKPKELRVPHIGWNDTVSLRDESLIGTQGKTDCFYYVHSFHLVPDHPEEVALQCTYGLPFTAGVQRGNIYGVQFHPEKSHQGGLALLKRFLEVPIAQTSSDPVSVSTERAHRP